MKSFLKVLASISISLQFASFSIAQNAPSNTTVEPEQKPATKQTLPQEQSDEETSQTEDTTTDENENEEDSTLSSVDEKTLQEEDPPEISYDLEALPFPTRRMHQLILEATKSGDIEKLRTYIGTGDSMTMLSLGDFDGDPIKYLKQESGDKDGHEILAILEEVLEAGYVHIDKGTDQELFVWPYFFAYPLDKLSAPQMVELFRIVTYGDFQDMQDFGGYIFYRAGITPTGRWTFFVAGD